MHILGVSCYFHDASAAILRDGQLIAAAEEERFSRVKHDFGFPARAIEFCLQTCDLRVEHVGARGHAGLVALPNDTLGVHGRANFLFGGDDTLTARCELE